MKKAKYTRNCSIVTSLTYDENTQLYHGTVHSGESKFQGRPDFEFTWNSDGCIKRTSGKFDEFNPYNLVFLDDKEKKK